MQRGGTIDVGLLLPNQTLNPTLITQRIAALQLAVRRTANQQVLAGRVSLGGGACSSVVLAGRDGWHAAQWVGWGGFRGTQLGVLGGADFGAHCLAGVVARSSACWVGRGSWGHTAAVQVSHNELVCETFNGSLLWQAWPLPRPHFTLSPLPFIPPAQASSVRAALLVQEEELKRHFDAVTGMMDGEEEEGEGED